MCKLLLAVLVTSELLCFAECYRIVTTGKAFGLVYREARRELNSAGDSSKEYNSSAHAPASSEGLSLVAHRRSKFDSLKAAASARAAANEAVLAPMADGFSNVKKPTLRGPGPDGERTKYELEVFIAHGSQGSVYRGVRTKTGEQFAFKFCDPPHAREMSAESSRYHNAEYTILTSREFQVVPQLLTAEHVFRVKQGYDAVKAYKDTVLIPDGLDVFVPDGSLCTIMPLARGGTLQEAITLPVGTGQLVSKEGFEERIGWFGEIVKGVLALHEHGYVHGDLKPANILFRDPVQGFRGGHAHGGIALTDFGVSAYCPEGESFEERQAPQGVGTPGYRPPEMFQGRIYSQRMDTFGLGVILHEMITGKKLFDTDSFVEQASRTGIAVWLAELDEQLSRRYKDIDAFREGTMIRAWKQLRHFLEEARVRNPMEEEDLDEAFFFMCKCLLRPFPVASMLQYKVLGLGGSRSAMAEFAAHSIPATTPVETPKPRRQLEPIDGGGPSSMPSAWGAAGSSTPRADASRPTTRGGLEPLAIEVPLAREAPLAEAHSQPIRMPPLAKAPSRPDRALPPMSDDRSHKSRKDKPEKPTVRSRSVASSRKKS